MLDEIKKYPEFRVVEEGEAEIYLELVSNLKIIYDLRSIINVYLVKRDNKLNPHFVSKHKSTLEELITIVLKESGEKFNTFKLSCAGPESQEVHEIKNFIINTYKLAETEVADMEIFIGKQDDLWEIGVRLTQRPLSLRKYKIENIKGGLNPTIAYAMNTFCDFNHTESYLNIFSGSGTLLIEAGLSNSKIKLVGFDINGKSNAMAVQNIKKAGLIKSIQLKTADVLNNPDLGKFNVITSDLPFGMQISKGEDLEKLYKHFINYCEEIINPMGTLIAYTTEHKLLNKILIQSKFSIIKTLELKISTITNAYIYPKIFVCKNI